MHACPNKHILVYVHHHGTGHLKRMCTLIPAIERIAKVSFLAGTDAMASALNTHFPNSRVFILPSKWPSNSPSVKRTFDRAFEGIGFYKEAAARSQYFCTLLVNQNIDLFISDVSAELTILARQCGVKVVMQRHSGYTGQDPTQVFAYECAESLYAPYPQSLELKDYGHLSKTHYLGFLGQTARVDVTQPRVITVLVGDTKLRCAISEHLAQNGFTVNVVGEWPEDAPSFENIHIIGSTDNVGSAIVGDIVICSAGNNLISELVYLNKKLILIPEPRPYSEQEAKAIMIQQTEAGRYCLPEQAINNSKHFIKLVEDAINAPPPALQALHNPNAAAEFKQLITETL